MLHACLHPRGQSGGAQRPAAPPEPSVETPEHAERLMFSMLGLGKPKPDPDRKRGSG